ncbi:MAG: thioredoxin [Alphaproteobacteria bacterium]|nr:thioredoxin [Alphaproteobacteria bacterium]
MLIFDNQSNASPSAVHQNLIKKSSTETFLKDVIETSNDTPVIVDFWAPWCGPCKQLGPLLEKAVKEAKGALKLVKIDVDRNQALAAQMQVQSIPAVYAFYKGRPIDGFMGSVPESQLKTFISNILKVSKNSLPESPIEQALHQVEECFNQNDFVSAHTILNQILTHEPTNIKALILLVRCLITQKKIEDARTVFNKIPNDQMNNQDVIAVKASLELAEQVTSTSSDITKLQAELSQKPNDLDLLLNLSHAYYAQNQIEDAINTLLDIMKKNRNWNEEAARKQLLKIFEALGPKHDLTLSGRRKLSALLFS